MQNFDSLGSRPEEACHLSEAAEAPESFLLAGAEPQRTCANRGTPSQILYDIFTEAPLSNDTFLSNGSRVSRVTCLFQDTSNALSGATIGFPTGLHFRARGTYCLPPPLPPPEKNQTSEAGKKSAAGAMGNGWGTNGSVLLLTTMVASL